MTSFPDRMTRSTWAGLRPLSLGAVGSTVLAGTLAACGFSPTPKPVGDLMAQIRSLQAVSPVSAKGAAAVVGGTFTQTGERAAFVDLAGSSPSFREIKLALPKERATNGGRIWARVREGECVTEEEARGTFGMDAPIPTHPGAPAPEFDMRTYAHDLADFRLGFDRNTGCLALVIIEQKR